MLRKFILSLLLTITTAIFAEVEKEHVLCFGDSITQGTYINGKYVKNKSWVDALQRKSGDSLVCINEGRSGRQTRNKNELLKSISRNKKVDHVIFYLGVNDLHFSDKINERNLKDCVTNSEWMIKKVRKAYGNDLKITILSSPGLAVDSITPRFRKIGFNSKAQTMLIRLKPLYEKLAKENSCNFIDLWGVVSTQNYSDGLHPNLAGQKQTAEFIWNSLVNKGAPQKIACIGDSITFGSGIKDRKNDSYPAQLQKLLGERYKVDNFGLSGRTLLKKGNRPYWKENSYKKALKSSPNYVIIKLGTNDTKPQNWKHKSEFACDLKELAQSFINLPSRPKVFLSTPAPVVKDRWGINEKSVKEGVIPIVNEVAKELNLQVIDFYNAIPAKSELIPDGVHPNKKGASYMANEVYNTILDKNKE